MKQSDITIQVPVGYKRIPLSRRKIYNKKCLTILDVCEELKVREAAVWRWIDLGCLPAKKSPGLGPNGLRWIIDSQVLDAFIKAYNKSRFATCHPHKRNVSGGYCKWCIAKQRLKIKRRKHRETVFGQFKAVKKQIFRRIFHKPTQRIQQHTGSLP